MKPETVTPPPTPVDPDEIRRHLLDLVANLSPLREAVDGYRAQAIAAGYSAVGAEQMAVDLHRHMLAAAFGGQGGSS